MVTHRRQICHQAFTTFENNVKPGRTLCFIGIAQFLSSTNASTRISAPHFVRLFLWIGDRLLAILIAVLNLNHSCAVETNSIVSSEARSPILQLARVWNVHSINLRIYAFGLFRASASLPYGARQETLQTQSIIYAFGLVRAEKLTNRGRNADDDRLYCIAISQINIPTSRYLDLIALMAASRQSQSVDYQDNIPDKYFHWCNPWNIPPYLQQARFSDSSLVSHLEFWRKRGSQKSWDGPSQVYNFYLFSCML